VVDTYLAFVEDCSYTVEEVEWREDTALDEYACNYHGSCPYTGANGHFEEPLLKWEL
jgi:hypothetical protein